MTTLEQITTAIKQEIISHSNESYYGSVESENNESLILSSLETLCSYNSENDACASDYFLKATSVEVWEYYLSVIIPDLSLIRL